MSKAKPKVRVLSTRNPFATAAIGKIAVVLAQEGALTGTPTDSYLIRIGNNTYAGFTAADLQVV